VTDRISAALIPSRVSLGFVAWTLPPQAPATPMATTATATINHDERARQPAQASARPAAPCALDVASIDRPVMRTAGATPAMTAHTTARISPRSTVAAFSPVAIQYGTVIPSAVSRRPGSQSRSAVQHRSR
jgi:hypothetical protein